jgi:hypothetical protein
MRLLPSAGRALVTLAFGLSLTACGTSYQPSRYANFDVDGGLEIDDEDIKKAFEARPQLPAEAQVAYYTFDPEIAKDLDETLGALPGVKGVYRIPSLLITGQRRMEESNPWAQPREVGIKKLRLLAARAHADVLVIVDHGYRSPGANALSAFNILLVPALFVPFLDNRVEGYAEAFIIDVRNGYLYGHVVEDDKRGPAFATIYAPSAKEIAGEQWQVLRGSLRADMARLLTTERAGSAAPRGTASSP